MIKKTKIAIFGSASHIAKGLINNFFQDKEFSLHLYTRSPKKVRNFLSAVGRSSGKNCVIQEGYDNFLKNSYDVVINCVGVGTLNNLQGDYTKYFTVTEEYDNLAIGYLCDIRPGALYINFSSGAVYGRGLSAPAGENAVNRINVNHIATDDYYAIVRLNAEAKHRAFKNLRIVDLRIFSYFSRFIDLKDNYFIAEIIDCILHKKTFVTDNVNIVRDYIHPKDLFSLICKCLKLGKVNAAFDAISSKPVKKKEILDYFSSAYGLKYKIGRPLIQVSATGQKNIYCSNYRNAASIGHKPAFSSMEAIKEESKYILR